MEQGETMALKKKYLALLEEARDGNRIIFPRWQQRTHTTPVRPDQMYKPRFLYAFRCMDYVKVGQSEDWRARPQGFMNNCPFDLTKIIVRKVPLAGICYAEAYALSYMPRPHRGEWFIAPPAESKFVYSLIEKAARRGLAYADHLADEIGEPKKWNRGVNACQD